MRKGQSEFGIIFMVLIGFVMLFIVWSLFFGAQINYWGGVAAGMVTSPGAAFGFDNINLMVLIGLVVFIMVALFSGGRQ